MTPTEKLLIEAYGSPVLDTADLAKVFKLKSPKVVRDMIGQDTFYVPTYKLTDKHNAKIVADVPVVAAYLDSRRAA